GCRATPDRGHHPRGEGQPGRQERSCCGPVAAVGGSQHPQDPEPDRGQLPPGQPEEEPDPGPGVVVVDVVHEGVLPSYTGTTGAAAAAPVAPLSVSPPAAAPGPVDAAAGAGECGADAIGLGEMAPPGSG